MTITITDRNETKYLYACGFTLTPAPRDKCTLHFIVEATDELFEARRSFALNTPVPVQSFISASIEIDRLIYAHRDGGVR